MAPKGVDAPEQRTIDVDVRDIDTRGRTLHGYAAVYNVESDDLGGFREKIVPGAFAGVLDADVRALLNHNPNEVLGRTKSGTLRLFDEQRGLRFEVDLPDSPIGENVREAVRRKDIDGASCCLLFATPRWRRVGAEGGHGHVLEFLDGLDCAQVLLPRLFANYEPEATKSPARSSKWSGSRSRPAPPWRTRRRSAGCTPHPSSCSASSSTPASRTGRTTG
jgi:HK97 family phage prohead protease